MSLREDKSSSVGLNFLLSLPLKTEILTPEIVTCQLLVLKETYNFTIFSIQVCLWDIFSYSFSPSFKR